MTVAAAGHRIPEVYVLWHPLCAGGERLAKQIYAWLRPGNGLGPHVFFRSLPAPGAAALPLSLPHEMRANTTGGSGETSTGRSNLQIVLPLIDENMIASPAWRHWLEKLAAPSQAIDRRCMPVALDATAYNAGPLMRRANYLRPTVAGAGAATSAQGPAPDASGGGPAAAESLLCRSLLKQVTEALCRLMLGRRGTPVTPTESGPPGPGDDLAGKVRIFLSHAKADGTGPSRRIRDYIYGKTQLAAFYDENDIPFASAFAEVLERDVAAPETAALIAVRTAKYALRPWCRRELALFRRPTRDVVPSAGGIGERWRLNPILVVEAMEGGTLSVGIPEFGNAGVIRWDGAVPDLEELIVTTLLRDAMLAEFHSAVGRSIATDAKDVVINWLPDPTSLLQIDRVRKGDEIHVVYPGRGLSGLELDVLSEYFPHVEFHSFEERAS